LTKTLIAEKEDFVASSAVDCTEINL